MASFITELKRRNVFKVGVAYAIVAWLLIQVSATILPTFNAPGWIMQVFAFFVILGFPIALIFAWAFELTPEGIKPTKEVDTEQSIARTTGENLKYTIIGLLALSLIFVVTDSYILDETSTPLVAEITGNVSPEVEPDNSINVAEPVPGFSGRAAIAVLPFINLSNDPEQEYFADGITEDLITGLQSFQSFPIIARTSTFQYKGTSPDIREVASALGAGYVIEGSVRKVADDIRINVQLIDREGKHVWAEIYNFKYEDVLGIQVELVSKIMLAIEPELIINEADLSRFVRTEDMEAYDYFLRATANSFASNAYTDLNGQAVTPERIDLAFEYATKAVELDPNFAAGWRLLNHIEGSKALRMPHLFSEEERQAAIERSIEYGERSRQLSPFEPAVCSCLSKMLLITGDVGGALLLQEEALKQNPANAAVHVAMATILQAAGEYERALEEIALAKRLSPEDIGMTELLYYEASIYQGLGRFDEAVTAANRSLLFSSLNFEAEYVKIISLYAAGQRDLAQTALIELRGGRPTGFQPASAWGGLPFPESAANNIKLASGASLNGLNYSEGLRLVFEDLGWFTN